MNYGPMMGMGMGQFASAAAKPGIFGSLFRGFNLSSIIGNTTKTLNIINQAIPLVQQVKPAVANAKTMFKVMNEFKKPDEPVNTVMPNNSLVAENTTSSVVNEVRRDENLPTFFV